MRKINLGQTGLKVTEIGMGGIPMTSLTKEEAIKLIRHCQQRGINFFDTAAMYGESESLIGQALEPVRNDVILATKTHGRDVEVASEHLQNSLRDLKTDFIDLYQLHNVSTDEDFEAIMAPGSVYDMVANGRDQGKIGHIGVSSHHPEVALRAIESGKFETIQYPFNFVENKDQIDLFAKAKSRGMGVIVMKPLGGGLLEQARLCFGYLQKFPEYVPIPGFGSLTEADEIINLYETPKGLSKSDLADIDRIRNELNQKFCHRCGYCMPCQQDIDIPMAMMIPVAIRRGDIKRLIEVFGPYIEKADDCLDCGECVDKCPYLLSIPEVLKKYRAAYDKART